jgi:hypothetical protein
MIRASRFSLEGGCFGRKKGLRETSLACCLGHGRSLALSHFTKYGRARANMPAAGSHYFGIEARQPAEVRMALTLS